MCLPVAAAAPKPDTAAAIQTAGTLACGIVAPAEDWSRDDPHGPLDQFDSEICRAVAAAVLGSASTAKIQTYPGESEALDALTVQKIDLVVGVTPSVTVALARHLRFGPVLLWDQGGFLVRDGASIAGKRVCFIEGSRTEHRLQARGKTIIRLPYQEQGEMEDALAGGACQAIAADFSRLYAIRRYLPAARLAVIADPEALDPLTPAVRDGDARWAAIVATAVAALIRAEATGVTAANAKSLRAGDDPDRQLLAGADWASAAALGLKHDWAVRMLSATGNYGEISGRTLAMPRGVNALWLHGGLIAPMPLR